MILDEGGGFLTAGVTIGVVGAFLGARLIQGVRLGVAPDDPITCADVVGRMAAMGIGAC